MRSSVCSTRRCAGEVLGRCRGKELVRNESFVFREAEELVVAMFEEFHGNGAVVIEGFSVLEILRSKVVFSHVGNRII